MPIFNTNGHAEIAGYDVTTPLRFVIVTLVVVLFLLQLLRWALPKPFLGIPHNKDAARHIMGDIPEMKKAKGIRLWYREQLSKHQSPIVQVFNKPFRGPLLLVADAREAQDVLMRRTREFDKSSLTGDSFKCLLGNSHISMKSADPRYKHNKELLRDLMSPAFLNEVSAPEIHNKITLLIDLWTIKAQAANGRPFAANADLHAVALDIIMAATFDFPQSDTTLLKQIAHSTAQEQERSSNSVSPQSEPFPFSRVPYDPELEALAYLTQSFAVSFRSPLPTLGHWLYLQKPHSRRAQELRKQVTLRNIEKSIARLQTPGREVKLKCAVDQLLLREKASAEKRGMPPDFYKGEIFDELFGYIVGGHDTVSTTLAWWVKLMSRFQSDQTHLRDTLYAAHTVAFSEARLPTASEITRVHVPYLDAIIEETHRYVHIVPGVLREAKIDTEILGHPIPKGTNLFFITSAASFKEPAYAIDEEKRAETARQAKDRYGQWDPANIGDYVPERWLRIEKSREEGEMVEREIFDPHAGPQMAFGSGPRGCFGRKLAYLELRIVVTILVWSFEFLELEEDLNSFEVLDTFALQPATCYIRPRKIHY